MRSLVISLLLLTASATALHADTRPSLEALPQYTFEEYVAAYGKSYSTPAEQARRKTIFEQNLKRIVAHNTNPAKSYTMNVNHMADWTRSEFRGLLGQIPTGRRGLMPFLTAVSTTADTPTLRVADLPQSVDWRNKSVVTPVKNQGNCGSCWAFASTETMESHWALATGKLYELSTQQITSCTPNPEECGGSGGCDGATENLAFEYAVKESGGITLAKDWPYTATDGSCTYPKDAPRVANFSSYVIVKGNDQDAMLTAVATKGPVTIGVAADTFDFYSSGIFDGCSYNDNIDINHAVQLVGYGTEGDKDYWIVRNSWGQFWGERGYIRLLRDKEAKCGYDKTPKDGSACKNDPDTPVKVCGQCGLLYESSYPIAKV